jgi:hypothetical protein
VGIGLLAMLLQLIKERPMNSQRHDDSDSLPAAIFFQEMLTQILIV